MRERLKDELKKAMLAKNQQAVGTLRLILAALKDRDIAARGKGNSEGIAEDEILAMLQTMIKQRRESIEMFEQGGRHELAGKEAGEIAIIEDFLPRQMDQAEIEEAVKSVIAESEASSLKDMGKVMAALRADYAGRMDFGKAGALTKTLLSG
ncbi:MAG: GatB/YqeY domain-containing protein [Alphaproteobacteria bacterium]